MRLTTEQQKAVESLLSLAQALARKYPTEDAQSVAYMALCRAVLSYNPERGRTLQSYAYLVIRNDLLKQMRDCGVRRRRVETCGDMDTTFQKN